jgi:hypothetical protein
VRLPATTVPSGFIRITIASRDRFMGKSTKAPLRA